MSMECQPYASGEIDEGLTQVSDTFAGFDQGVGFEVSDT
jgi:hypothetical protein